MTRKPNLFISALWLIGAFAAGGLAVLIYHAGNQVCLWFLPDKVLNAKKCMIYMLSTSLFGLIIAPVFYVFFYANRTFKARAEITDPSQRPSLLSVILIMLLQLGLYALGYYSMMVLTDL